MNETYTCPHCDAALPSGSSRFCIECGGVLTLDEQATTEEAIEIRAATGITVKLSNATVEQSVLGVSGGSVTGDAIPPGMWSADRVPDASDTVAVYVPLRAIVTGWSGLIDTGWILVDQLAPERNSSAPRFRFETTCRWFPAPGFGLGMQLLVRVTAEAEAQEGRSRRGFRYRTDYDPPMAIAEAHWQDAQGRPAERVLPLPRIQLMAPPRIPRGSDFPDKIRILPAERALAWAREGHVHERFELLNERQQRTPAGRGILLGIPNSFGFFSRLFGKPEPRYHVRLLQPFQRTWKEWQRLQREIRARGEALGFGSQTDATIEWWLDQEGYDSVVLTEVSERYDQRKVAIAFRRNQIAQVEA